MICGMTIETIITQVLALICNTYTAFAKHTKHIYVENCLFNIFAMLTGLLQQDYGLCLSYMVVIYRSILMLYKTRVKQKYPHFSITFVTLHIVLGLLTWQNGWSMIPIITPIFTGLIMWYSDDLQVYRVNNVLNNFLWLIHNLYSHSYILVVTRVYAMTVNAIAFLQCKKTLFDGVYMLKNKKKRGKENETKTEGKMP